MVDFNGDGLSDIVVGAYQYGAAEDGAAYVVFGRAPTMAVTRMGSAAGQYITGGLAVDQLSSGDGNDVVEGRGDADLLDGGSGKNTASYEHAPLGITASLSNPASNTNDALGDQYTSIHNLWGSRLADTLIGDGGANTLTGDKGNDILKGMSGNDRLVGGLGKDKQTGGPGKDVFVFAKSSESRKGSNADEITDFKPGNSSSVIDKIDISAMDANASKAGNQKFKFIGTAPFTKKGQLRIKKTSAGIVVQGNTSGSTKAEFEILLKGTKEDRSVYQSGFQALAVLDEALAILQVASMRG